jgi:type I restriction enzyme S subunit
MKKGWEKKAFEDCLDKVTYSSKIQRKDFLDYGKYPIVSQEEDSINGYWNNGDDVFKVKRPVIIFGDHTQILKFVDFDFVLGADGVKLLQPCDFIFPKFFYYQLQSMTIEKLGYARHYRLLREKEIVYPPLPEQQRIVKILDEAIEGIATAKANAEKNLQNTHALFESELHSIFTNQGKNWVKLSLGNLLEKGWIEGHLDGNHGGDYPRKEEFVSIGVPYISANCIDEDSINMSRAKYLSKVRASQFRKGVAHEGDVLFAHNATVGPVAILRTSEKMVILSTSLTYYRCNIQYILPEYLAHYMRSFEFKSQYLQVMRQSTRNQVPITKQREFFHIVPPLSEQKVIVRKLDSILGNIKPLESIYKQKLLELDALKKSILNEAFSGNL